MESNAGKIAESTGANKEELGWKDFTRNHRKSIIITIIVILRCL